MVKYNDYDSYIEEQEKPGEGFVTSLYNKFIPYWLLFALLFAILAPLAVLYALTGVPTYQISASIAINDEEKGAGEAPLLQSLNIYASKKIVENEVQVLQSRSLVRNVVDDLALYAPVYQKHKLVLHPVYAISPVKIRLRKPDALKGDVEIPFEWDAQAGRVQLAGNWIPVNSWAASPYGTIYFERDSNQVGVSSGTFYFSLIDPRIAVENVSKRLKVSGTGKMATIVNIAYEDELPERGVDVINKLLDTYSSFSIQAKNQLAENTLVFLNERLKRVKEDLDTIEARVQGYRSSQGVIDISEQGKIYLENVAESDRRAADVGMQLAVLDQVERYVRSGASSTGIVPTSLGIDDPVLADLLQRLNDLELRYANLRTTTGTNNPIVNSVANEIAKIRPNILNIVTNQRARLRASQSNLQQTVNRSSAQLRSLPLKERELLTISRQQTTLRSIYEFLLQKREEAALTNASVISDSRLIDRPEAAVRPSGTGKLIYLMIAGVLAFIFTIAYVLLKENFTRKILFRSAVEEKIGIPVIGEILYIKNASDKVKSKVVERQWNDIQAALGFFDKNLNNRKVVITSWKSAEGKTFVTTGLGTSIAATGKRVVILDLNLHRAALSVKLEMKGQKGFTDFINGDAKAESILYQTSWNAHLYLIPAGTIPGNTIAMLLTPKWDELMNYLERQFDFILIDTPAVEQSTDARVLAKHADKVVWVARHRKTPDTVLQTLKEGWDKNMGILFNGVKGRGFLKRYYGHGFGYGYDNLATDRFDKV